MRPLRHRIAKNAAQLAPVAVVAGHLLHQSRKLRRNVRTAFHPNERKDVITMKKSTFAAIIALLAAIAGALGAAASICADAKRSWMNTNSFCSARITAMRWAKCPSRQRKNLRTKSDNAAFLLTLSHAPASAEAEAGFLYHLPLRIFCAAAPTARQKNTGKPKGAGRYFYFYAGANPGLTQYVSEW